MTDGIEDAYQPPGFRFAFLPPGPRPYIFTRAFCSALGPPTDSAVCVRPYARACFTDIAAAPDNEFDAAVDWPDWWSNFRGGVEFGALDEESVLTLPASPAIRVPKASRQLTKWAVWVLPAESRTEFAEQFSADLVHLARQQKSWLAQVRHSTRVLVRAPWLRRELRTPAPALRKGTP
ncbi:hypothetical protein ACWEGE_35760 [Amycolatopsis sp. NPDC004747]